MVGGLALCVTDTRLLCAVQYSKRYSHSTITVTVQYSTVQYSVVQCGTVWYSTVQYSTVQYSTA